MIILDSNSAILLQLTKYWQSEYQLQEKQKAGTQQQQQQQSNYNYSQNNYGHHHQHQQQQSSTLNQKNQLFAEETGPLGHCIARPLVDINDLIHLDAPITEDSLIRALQSRFNANEFFVSVLLCL